MYVITDRKKQALVLCKPFAISLEWLRMYRFLPWFQSVVQFKLVWNRKNKTFSRPWTLSSLCIILKLSSWKVDGEGGSESVSWAEVGLTSISTMFFHNISFNKMSYAINSLYFIIDYQINLYCLFCVSLKSVASLYQAGPYNYYYILVT